MKKLTNGTALLFAVLLASIMLLSGCDTLFGEDGDGLGDATQFDKKFTVEAGKNISIDMLMGDIVVGRSSDDKVHITYYEYDRVKYEIKAVEGLSITQTVGKGSFGEMKGVSVLVPDVDYGTFSMDTASANITVKDITLRGAFSAGTGSGDITVTDITSAGAFSAGTGSGIVAVTDISADSVVLGSGSGKVTLHRLSSNRNISIKVSSADAVGTIVGSKEDFKVTNVIDNSNGKGTGTINPAAGGTGSKELSLETESGDISITFTK